MHKPASLAAGWIRDSEKPPDDSPMHLSSSQVQQREVFTHAGTPATSQGAQQASKLPQDDRLDDSPQLRQQKALDPAVMPPPPSRSPSIPQAYAVE